MKHTVRNKQFDIMRAVGILGVIWGHNYQPPYIFFPAFYFVIGLFFFISGYFFTPQVTIFDKFSYFINKTRKQLLPYFLLNILFGLITMWLISFNIHLGNALNFNSLFVMPFERGDQFVLYLAAWFLFTLYFVSIFAGFVYQKNRLFNIGIVLYAVVMMLAFLHIGKNPGNPHWLIFIIKCMFGFGFFSLGYLFKVLEPYIKKFILQPITLLILYITVVSLNEYFGNISYTTLDGDISNKIIFIPIITSLCIILMMYSLSYYATKILKEKSFIYTVGEYSFSIMVFHLTFFFLVNVVLYHLSLIPYTALSDVYYRYKIEKLWLVYQVPAIIGPILLVRYYKLLQQKVLYNSYLLYVRFKNVLIR